MPRKAGRFASETQRLIRSWMRHEPAMLRDYLVRDVEDPRLNVQSILARHFLIGRLLPGRFGPLMDEELRFAVAMNWLLAEAKRPEAAARLPALHMALLDGADSAEGRPIPAYVRETFARLPREVDGAAVPDFLGDALLWPPAEGNEARLPVGPLSTFQRLWRQALAAESAPPVSVLEIACGSANDFRFLDAYGIARHLDYTGIDLCEANVRNAAAMFPAARFSVANALELPFPDKSFDLCFVHDLFEHLSVAAMEQALAELGRVTRKAAALGFFRMHPGARHIMRRVEAYHLNTLSTPATASFLRRQGARVRIVPIDRFLRVRFGCADTHNTAAHTLLVQFHRPGRAVC